MEENASLHFLWISRLVSRIKHAANFSKPLLCLSFCRHIPPLSEINMISDDPSIENLSQGSQYALISSILTNDDFESHSPLVQFEFILNSLKGIGYRPHPPCHPQNLSSGSIIDHINLCSCIEFAVVDKSLSIEILLEDLRRVPRSFFVLKQYPTQLEDAVKLWLSKFPCVFEIPDFSDDIQNDIKNGIHVAAILSRIFPQQIDKKSIISNTPSKNWNLISSILNEVEAFIPKTFPVPENLFLCFVADLFFTTRAGNRKFVKLDTPKLNYSHNGISPASSNTSIKPILLSSSIHSASPQVIKPSPRGMAKNSCCLSSNNNEKIDDFNNLSHNNNLNMISNSIEVNNNDKNNDLINPNEGENTSCNKIKPKNTSTNELMELYIEINKTGRLIIVDDFKVLIRYLSKMMESPEQTFRRLWRFLQPKKHGAQLYSNGRQFLSILSNEKNEFDASQKVVKFAQTMMNSENSSNLKRKTNNKNSQNNCIKNVVKSSLENRIKSMKLLNYEKGFSISTQTSSMTHGMSFIRDTKPVKVATNCICEMKSISTQTESEVLSPRRKQKNFETVTYPYGETSGGFSATRRRLSRDLEKPRRGWEINMGIGHYRRPF
ncbi:hypothetical protein TRFO_34652 [Tritrichomonas foetus]|uniref:Uncharacterized protein n=1 Tax=Tritrichomonas foetus TaxID=1144522 RepID=A0A1J4JKN5_9EUKA|nr:hypothetical protein TRFO_34652 [Tritrichomonas foetus]|eukprot:OHS98967.1 hypothetical protein TRFO_34652 [Tritrichomonas foetus]